MTFKRARHLTLYMIFVYAFMYLPIGMLVLFSFNASENLSQWSGFSLKWYESLFKNEKLISATLLSAKIAMTTATIAVLVGTVASIVIVRYRSFKGRGFFNNLVTAPLVMPDVMTGLSLLILFIFLQKTFGWRIEKGFMTMTIGHTTLAIAYVILIVRARLLEFDQSIEEAALDLGAKPLQVFWSITLPLIFPAIASGWLLAFTLSFDDVILSSFLSGPGYTTLPMVVFSSIRFGVTPMINALATIIVSFVAVSVIMSGVFVYRRKYMINKQI